ncbi:hypothetical protein CHS0354_033405 [Potamilus streckersoni]|uniref:Glycosyltransferase 61 catalytic domain-containing protein n=1 Tax=Potamilus streckersoni TaxID=2493646 RepID=A0AAE0SQZ0_9BIVA|nr:hypothetical protein CHS0354_033405 [Potamilus streckersoni]
MKWKLRLLVIVFGCVILVLLQNGFKYAWTVKNKIQGLPSNGVLVSINLSIKAQDFTTVQAILMNTCLENFRQINITEPVTHTKTRYAYFDASFTLKRGMVYTWTQANNAQKTCDNSLVLYGNRFAELHDVIMDTTYINQPFSKGGQTFKEAIKSDLDKESNWAIRPGFWKLRCNDTKRLDVNNIAVPFYKALSLMSKQTNANMSDSNTAEKCNVTVISNFTVAISRGDYWNLHQYMMHCLDTFLMMVLYGKKPGEVSLLLVDGHPELFIYDNTWKRVFGPVLRAGHFEHPVQFKHLIWGIKEGFSPIAQYKEEKQCLEFGLPIIRRNYISRLGDRQGNAERKIFNEGEVLAALKALIPNSIVSGRVMDSSPMEDQLIWISETDILVGVHGAGMTHTLFLPKHAGIFEIFPQNFKSTRSWYCVYEAVARWRSLSYISWTNTNPENEIEGGFLNIPVESLIVNVKDLYRRICPKTEILT